jgi:hypothetical protein
VVRLFARDKANKENAVQSLMLKVVNANCPQLRGLMEGPRRETRVNLCLVVMVIPVEKGKPLVDDRFTAVTKEFTTRGVSLVLQECNAPDEMILGLRWERSMRFMLAETRHLSPMGGGFWQLGLRLKEVLHTDDYPGLADLQL